MYRVPRQASLVSSLCFRGTVHKSYERIVGAAVRLQSPSQMSPLSCTAW